MITKRLIDQNGSDVSGFVDWSDPHKQCHVLIVEIATLTDFVNRAGFAPHRESSHLRERCGTTGFGNPSEDCQHIVRNFSRDDTIPLEGIVIIVLEEGKRASNTLVGKNRIGAC